LIDEISMLQMIIKIRSVTKKNKIRVAATATVLLLLLLLITACCSALLGRAGI
jgi:hypothetical protein